MVKLYKSTASEYQIMLCLLQSSQVNQELLFKSREIDTNHYCKKVGVFTDRPYTTVDIIYRYVYLCSHVNERLVL